MTMTKGERPAGVADEFADYDLSTRALNGLRRGGYRTAAEVRATPDIDLLDIRSFGAGLLAEVRAKLGPHDPASAAGCSVIQGVEGVIAPCSDTVTTRVVMRCDEGHERVVDVCDFHARMASEDDPATECRRCGDGGNWNVRAWFVSAAPLSPPTAGATR